MPCRDGIDFRISLQDAHKRLDAVLTDRLPDLSRSYAAVLIRGGYIKVDAVERKPSYKVKSGERVAGTLPEPEPAAIASEPMALDIIFEDDALIVLNKPAGLVVHPAAGHAKGTLVNGLLHHCPNLEGIGGEKRPGIVHRLDKDTSGVMVVTKTTQAHHALSRQFKQRSIRKTYLALVQGAPGEESGMVDLPVGRHPVDRKKMSTISRHPRGALTVWRVKDKFPGCTLLEVDLKTGRTHQIRVHCKAMGCPIVGDPLYGARLHNHRSGKRQADISALLASAKRQMLHAHRLVLFHPITGTETAFSAPLPEDMQTILDTLTQLNASNG